MLLCLDVGNTQILGGVFEKETLVARFRYATHLIGTVDQFGTFLLNVLSAKKISPAKVTATALSSVVPHYDVTIKEAIASYFEATFFKLQASVKTGLIIQYKNPTEVGADRIANAIGALSLFPEKNCIVVDMGTVTTLCAIDKEKHYLGGSLLPGMRLAMESLKNNTAKLMEVDIEVATSYLGRSTRENIQSGLYFGQLGAIKEIMAGYKTEVFNHEPVTVIGTGGFSHLFKDASLFDVISPDLVLQGLCKAYYLSGS